MAIIIQYNENWNVVNNTSEVITAYRNYWGLTEANEIDAKIKDDNEDASTGPVQFNPFLTDNPTIVESAHRVLPTQYSLEQNYPNPFNLNTNIFITLPVTNEVSLFIHDINGRLVDTIHLGKLYAGSHIFTWNASKISSGLYFITLKTERFNKVIKCTLLK